jgi:hypothetical protein
MIEDLKRVKAKKKEKGLKLKMRKLPENPNTGGGKHKHWRSFIPR